MTIQHKGGPGSGPKKGSSGGSKKKDGKGAQGGGKTPKQPKHGSQTPAGTVVTHS